MAGILGINEEEVSADVIEPEVETRPPMFEFYTAPEVNEPEAPGFLDVIGRASEQTNLMTRGLIATYEASLDFPTDPAFKYREHQEELRDGVPSEYWHEIAAARSRKEADHTRWRIMDELEGQQEVAKAGWKGTAAQLVSGVLSPENIVPMGAAFSWANKGARLNAAMKTGAVTAAASGAAEAALVAGTFTKDAEDILYASTFGFVLGGTVGGILHKGGDELAEVATKLRDEMDTRMADDFDDAGAMRNREVEHQVVETSEREDDILDAANAFVADKGIQKQLDDSGTHKAAVMSKILASDFTRLISHPSNVVKKLAYDLLEGGTGAVKGQGRTGAQYKDIYERRILSKGLVPLNEQYSQWAKDQGMHWMKRNFHTDGYDRFYGEVRDVLEHRSLGKELGDINPNVLEAADRWDEMMEHALDIGKSSGIESFKDIKARKGYVPLHWNGRSILKAGKQNAQKLITKGYMSVGMDEDMAQKVAAAVVKRALDKRAGVDADISGLLKKNQRDQLAEQLGRMGLSREEVGSFIKQLDAREAKAGPGFTKSRTKIDMTLSENGLKMADLVDNDLNTLASSYAREVSGRAAFAKKGITTEAKWNAIKSAALKDNARIKSLGEKGDDKLGEHLDDVRSYFSAFPVAGGVHKNARRIQQTATVSSLGLVGAAQLAELGTVVGRMGIKAAAKAMPSVTELFTLATKVRHGKDPIIDELRPLLGDFDYDHLLYRPDIVLDDKITDALDTSSWTQVLDKGLGKMSTGLGYASGMNSVRHFEHQLAAKMIINKFADLAVNPDKVQKSLARMEDIGIDGADLAKITRAINKYAEFDNGMLKKMNLDKWDADTAEAFTFGINKHTAQVVQRQLAGETSAWMHKTIGSLLSQFRHFPIVAFEKQLLRNLKFHDQAFYTTMLYGFGVSYGIQAIKAGIAGEDINSPDTVKRAVNYMGMASVAPDVLTIAAQLNLVPEALNFRKVGNTGSRADSFDLIDYIPAAGQLNKFAKLAALPGKALQGEITNSDVRSGAMALPFATTIFSKALMSAMLED